MSFAITGHKGIRIRFENGWTVSIQFGLGNYCEHHDSPSRDWDAPRKADLWQSAEAETALISPAGKFVKYDGSLRLRSNDQPRHAVTPHSRSRGTPYLRSASEHFARCSQQLRGPTTEGLNRA